MYDILIFVFISLLAIFLAFAIPKRRKTKGVVVFDIDNTILCNGSLLGNLQCNHYPTAEWPCGNAETIHPYNAPQAKNQPVYDGKCVKDELSDGKNIDCSILNFNSLSPDPNLCISTIDNTTGKPFGIDCSVRDRTKALITNIRSKDYAIAINSARFLENITPLVPYLLYLGFTKDEVKSIEEGGVITYNKSKSTDIYTSAKQKAINMIAISKKFNVDRKNVILLDDQLVNCKAVRDMGFRAYNVSTTFGQMYGWSCDNITDVPTKKNSTCQCGITDNQSIEIINML